VPARFLQDEPGFHAGYGVRADMIAQSLNQIDKAYGEHYSILDSCHVRVAFSTIIERSLGHRLDRLRSPWPHET
jgi:type IV secretion system protein VirD4